MVAISTPIHLDDRSASSSVTPGANYVNPPTRPPAVQAICILLGVVVTVSLVLRLYTRGRVKRQFDLDDLFATIATLLTDTSLVVMIIMYAVFHQDRHTRDIPPEDLYEGQKLVFVYDTIFAQAACQSKLSLLFFSRKIIGAAKYGTFYPHYICLVTLIVIVALCEILFLILFSVECRPLTAAWDPHPTYPYKCFNTNSFFSIMGIINTLTDFLCTVLPAFIVLKLQMPLRKRIGVSSLFLVGIFVTVASALRIYYSYYQHKTSDTWNFFPSSLCCTLELGLGSLCVNIPIIRHFVAHKNKSKRRASNNTKYYLDSYGHSQHSNMFLPVGDFEAATFTANRISRASLPDAYRKETDPSSNGIEVLPPIELDSVSPPAVKEYGIRCVDSGE